MALVHMIDKKLRMFLELQEGVVHLLGVENAVHYRNLNGDDREARKLCLAPSSGEC
jgi:hypothetical protein